MSILQDGVFWVGLSTILAGSVALCCRTLYKCKITEMSVCWNMLRIKRDIEAEEDIDNRRQFINGTSTKDGASDTNRS